MTLVALVRYCLATVMVLAGALASAQVWQVRQQWSDEAEGKYQAWVEEKFDANFFYEGTPYANIPTDCADAAYGMRMVFSFENGLPFTIRDPRNTSKLLTQATTQFNQAPAGLPRFLRFLDWVSSMTGTATLANDTYPVKISRDSLKPGDIYLTHRNHAMQIKEVRADGVLVYLESTTPRAVRPMRLMTGFPPFAPADPKAKNEVDGYRRFKQPQHYHQPVTRLPDFGTEQFIQAKALGGEVHRFHDWMQGRLAIEEETPWLKLRRSFFALCHMVYDRASAVEEAQDLLKAKGGRCMNPQEYDEHSTPSRDKRLAQAFDYVSSLAPAMDRSVDELNAKAQQRYLGYLDHYQRALPPENLARVEASFLDWCDVGKVDGGPGRSMSLTELRDLMKRGALVADPNAPLLQRWGLHPYRKRCPAYD